MGGWMGGRVGWVGEWVGEKWEEVRVCAYERANFEGSGPLGERREKGRRGGGTRGERGGRREGRRGEERWVGGRD